MAIDITREQLETLFPRGAPEAIDAILTLEDWIASKGLLDTRKRWCHFVAQIAHESGGLTVFEENLNYRADRLCEVFPKCFPTLGRAEEVARQPEAIANIVYADKNRSTALGNTQPGDGWKYRGRGLIQITGRWNYAKYGELIGGDLIADPDRAVSPEISVKIAVEFFLDRKCLPKADADDVAGVTKLINGGTNGLEDRKAWLAKAKAIWTSEAPAAPAPVAATKPLIKSGTIWNQIAGLFSGFALWSSDMIAGLFDSLSTFATDFAPMKSALLTMGANAQAIALGGLVYFGIKVVQHRAKAKFATEGAAQ